MTSQCCLFFIDQPPTKIYPLSLPDPLPICISRSQGPATTCDQSAPAPSPSAETSAPASRRSEEHTSELQSPYDLVCRLLLENKKSTRAATRLTLSMRPVRAHWSHL